MAQNITCSPWGVTKGPWLFFLMVKLSFFCPVCFPCISFLLLYSKSPQYSSLNPCSFISSQFRNPAWHDLVLFSGCQMAKIKVSAVLSFHLEPLRKNPLSRIFMLQNSILCSHRIEFPISFLHGPSIFMSVMVHQILLVLWIFGFPFCY